MRLVRAIRDELRLFVSQLKPMPTTVFVVGAFVLWIYWYGFKLDFFDVFVAPRLKGHPVAYLDCLWWTLGPIPFLILIPHFALKIARRFSPDDPVPTEGFRLGNWRYGLTTVGLFYAVMIPVLLVFVLPNATFQANYPMCAEATATPLRFAVYELALVSYFIAWEYFFRGFLLFGLEKTLGVWTVFAQMLPFVVAHFDKPALEALSSILAGVALGWLALRTRSFWYGAIVHGGVDVVLDLMMTAWKHAHGHPA